MSLDNIEAGFTEDQLRSIMDVFTTEGWKLIQRDMSLYRKQMDTTSYIDSPQDLYTLKGELKKLDWFINLKEWYQAAEAYETNI
jgi:hypothetical protein